MRRLAVMLAIPVSLAAQTSPRVSADEQVHLALSAAPAHLRSEAGVYVLREHGYELVRRSANGFHCLVERWEGPPAPICYDRVGSESTLQVMLYVERRRSEGADDETLFGEIDERYASGEFKAPASQGVAYMLSEEGPTPPHVMYYAPYMTNAAFGGAEGSDRRTLPFVYHEGSPRAYVVQLVDPESVRRTSG